MTVSYCDHCGLTLKKGNRNAIAKLPINVSSAKAGESAELCNKCAHFVWHAGFDKAVESYIEKCGRDFSMAS